MMAADVILILYGSDVGDMLLLCRFWPIYNKWMIEYTETSDIGAMFQVTVFTFTVVLLHLLHSSRQWHNMVLQKNWRALK